MDPAHASSIVLDGSSLTPELLARLARDPRVVVACAPEALVRVRAGEAQIAAITERYRRDFEDPEAHPVLDYGVTTGFGEFKNIPIPPKGLEALQIRLLVSHAAGVGENASADDLANYFPAEVVRATLAVRLNCFLKGHSGVREALVEAVLAMLNRGIVPLVPIRGSVGSSGDLAPLAHLFAVLLGEGRYYRVVGPGDLRARHLELRSARETLEADLGRPLPGIRAKEGLALTNGANFSTALLALAVADGEALAATADLACALSLEAVCGCARALDPRVHQVRGHAGQIASAAAMRSHLEGSRLLEAAGAVQDVYSLRCAPQVHGAARDVLAYARTVAEREINAATDNPLFFPEADGEPWDCRFRANWPEGYDGAQRSSYSAGNFHGEPVGVAADALAIGVAELANVSERRIQMLLDGHHNRHLPGNLIPHRGLNSGLMIIQYCAAGVVSENKVLTHPASVDSIPTSANSEDHNAMATIAARKLRTVLANAQAVLAIELLTAAQAIDWRVGMQISPIDGTSAVLQAALAGNEGLTAWERAELEARLFAERTAPEQTHHIASHLGEGTRGVYLAVRERVGSLVTDERLLEPLIREVRRWVEEGGPSGASPGN